MLAQRAVHFVLLYCSLIIGEHLKSVKAVLEALRGLLISYSMGGLL